MLKQGSVSAAGPRQAALLAIMTLGGLVPALLASDALDVMLCGEEEASSLGVDVKQLRLWMTLWVSVITAGAVAVGAGVGFVGLIVPHALRPFVGSGHRRLIPYAFVGGGIFVVLCDVLCRVLPIRTEVPVGVLIDLIGAPMFVYLLVRLTRRELGDG